MRPEILNPFFRPVTSLPGIGPKLAKALARLLLGDEDEEPLVRDLLFHLPVAIVDRRHQPGIAASSEGAIVTLKLRVDCHQAPPRGQSRLPYRVFGHDDTGEIALVFFHADGKWLERTLPLGETRYVSGTMQWFNGRPSMAHPDHIVSEAEFASLPLIEPVYPLSAGLTRRILSRAVALALEEMPALAEWIDLPFLRTRQWPAFGEALTAAHHPSANSDLDPTSPARSRLAFDELFASQLALALLRARQRRALRLVSGRARQGDDSICGPIRAALPFTLTPSQERAIEDIKRDLARPERMLRLLQGDVGSGKTIVALMAMASAVEAGGQAALMAPTELLARQHLESMRPLADAAHLRLAILTGRERGREREELMGRLAAGDIDILIGTHALFQGGLIFHRLALAVVDEQHRFGVHQRLALAGKGEAVDVLVMTATPIPRTLVLAHFGDMDVSQLLEKPAGRRPIDTRTIPLDRLEEVIERVGAAIQAGQKIYWVCPLVEESEELDAAAATERASDLRARFGDSVELVHGRMKAAEKEHAFTRFRSGEARILVATTVVEVGVDVPDATIMVIEHAERFGLAQLHQLRGRVGRSSADSVCLLLYKTPLGTTARDRLEVLRHTEDGFRIAEEDLKLRGEGEILGTRQSGMPGFHFASAEHHAPLMEAAHDAARLVLATNPELEGEQGAALRTLLYLFGRDGATRLLGAG